MAKTMGSSLDAIFDAMIYKYRGRQAFTDICKGLFVLHAHQICHLDMKTPNVLIGSDGTCKISDMGLSKMLGTGNTNLTAESLGTLAYISPEQIRTGRAGLPADIWALGTILWEVSLLVKIASAQPELHHSKCI